MVLSSWLRWNFFSKSHQLEYEAIAEFLQNLAISAAVELEVESASDSLYLTLTLKQISVFPSCITTVYHRNPDSSLLGI